MEKAICNLVESYYLRIAAEKLNKYHHSQETQLLLNYNSEMLKHHFYIYLVEYSAILKNLNIDSIITCTFTAKEIRNGVYEILSDIPEICEGLLNVDDNTYIFKLERNIIQNLKEGQLYRPSSGCLYIQKKFDLFFFKQNAQVSIVKL